VYSLAEVRGYCESRGKRKPILDTNLLLLLLVGVCDKNFLSQHSCTEKYTSEDYDLLVKVLRYFEAEIIITPHVLAEFSDLSRRDIKEPRLNYYLSRVAEKLKSYREEHISLERLLNTKVHLLALYGFPDISLIEAAKKTSAVLITDDIGLGAYATSCLIPNVSFSAVQANSLISRTTI